MHLGSAPRIPCPLRRFRPGAVFLLQTQAVLSWAAHVDGRYATLLLRYSYASASLPVAVFSALRFSRIPAAQALCADVDKPSTECGDYATDVEASRQLVMMQPWPPSLLAEAHFFCRLSPSTYCRAALVPLAVSRLHVFLAVRQLQLWHS